MPILARVSDPRRRRVAKWALAGVLAVAVGLAGCGSSEDETPVACLEGPDPYLRALEGAPGAVRLDGGVPISDCVVENQSGGDLAAVGAAMVEAATKLNAEAREDPGGTANFELGYLVGAVARGAEDTQGIHTELLRRLAVSARYAPPGERPAPVFLATLRRGTRAGEAGG